MHRLQLAASSWSCSCFTTTRNGLINSECVAGVGAAVHSTRRQAYESGHECVRVSGMYCMDAQG